MNDATRKQRPNLSVLIVDADPSVLILLTGILESDGIRTLRARNAAEAEEIAGREYLTIDAALGNLSAGRQPMDALRRIRPGLRSLFMSARTESGVIRIELSPEHEVTRDHGLAHSIRALLAQERSLGAGQSIQ
jgi:CheY-like chemotaxis protein